MRLILALLMMASISVYAADQADSFLKKDQPFKPARKTVLAHGWKPFKNMDPSTLIGVDKMLYRAGYKEVYSCAMDIGVCILQYKDKKGQCLSVFVKGEELKDMVVSDWNNQCQ
ncbi:hypothetical protein [Paludibacterium purpuratum]|uniref:Beta/gamma crystallin n=1 Tax=Paludibacterium purpuratum TaxID=1144873 RepID=A0A4R7AWY7_9NEIS|nr:hypothetical protein [Paludibacterium purpuratum]TDR72044.1 hypothetical protein DFP86_11752 [Paludibacterium purpuratum]